MRSILDGLLRLCVAALILTTILASAVSLLNERGGETMPSLAAAIYAGVAAYFFSRVSGVWVAVGMRYRAILFVPSLAIMGWSAFHVLREGVPGPGSIDTVTWIYVISVAGTANCLTRRGSARDALEVANPLNESAIVVHGGASRLMNAHHRSLYQRYAVDIVRVVAARRATTVFPRSLADYVTFGTPVFSPVSGLITDMVNNRTDFEPGLRPSRRSDARGNYVTIDHHGIEILIAHLRESSILISVGQRVEVGDVLASVGNSGNTSEPHLHLQASRNGISLPITFGHKVPMRNDKLPSRKIDLHTIRTM